MSPISTSELPSVTDVRLLSLNALRPMVVTELGIVSETIALSSKALSSMLATAEPIVSDVISLEAKAKLPMLVTELGIDTFVKLSNRNAESPILVTEYPLRVDGMVRLVPHGLTQPVTVATPALTVNVSPLAVAAFTPDGIAAHCARSMKSASRLTRRC